MRLTLDMTQKDARFLDQVSWRVTPTQINQTLADAWAGKPERSRVKVTLTEWQWVAVEDFLNDTGFLPRLHRRVGRLLVGHGWS